MNIYSSRWRNSLKESQVTIRESSYGKYRVVTQNFPNEPRALSKNIRTFRNITNLTLKNSQQEVKPKVIERTRNNLSIKPIMNYSFGVSYEGLLTAKQKDVIPKGNPQECIEYASEIYRHMKTIEREYRIDANYMKRQKEINTTMRAILIDWLVDINVRFKFRSETLFLTVNILDRYLQKEEVSKSKLQLVGITAALIASKCEEIYPPKVKHFLHTTNYVYSVKDVLEMEGKILNALDFKLNFPSSNRFLQEFSKHLPSSKKTLFLAQFLLELSLLESEMLKYQFSLTAASALYVAKKATSDTTGIKNTMQVTGYTEIDLRDCKRDMVKILKELPKGTLSAVKRKFSSVKCMEVAGIKIPNTNRLS